MPVAGAYHTPPDLIVRNLISVADTLRVGGMTYLLIPIDAPVVDALAEYGSATEDFEEDGEDCCEAEDMPPCGAFGPGDPEDREIDDEDACAAEDFQARDDGAGDPEDAENDHTDFSEFEESGACAIDPLRFVTATRTRTFAYGRR